MFDFCLKLRGNIRAQKSNIYSSLLINTNHTRRRRRLVTKSKADHFFFLLATTLFFMYIHVVERPRLNLRADSIQFLNTNQRLLIHTRPISVKNKEHICHLNGIALSF